MPIGDSPVRQPEPSAASSLKWDGMTSAPQRLLFVHVMKTAGSYVNRYLVEEVLRPLGYQIHVSSSGVDWTPEQLMAIHDEQPTLAYVHNHVGNWPAEVFQAYRQSGWYTFSFVRNPADQWCSFYFWAREKPGNFAKRLSLDDFLARVATDRLGRSLYPNMEPPTYWRDLDLVAEFSADRFAAFLRPFDHEYEPTKRVNVSANRGYSHYRLTGEVSDEVHQLLLASRHYRVFREVTGVVESSSGP